MKNYTTMVHSVIIKKVQRLLGSDAAKQLINESVLEDIWFWGKSVFEGH